jgi:hypothetical protein
MQSVHAKFGGLEDNNKEEDRPYRLKNHFKKLKYL